MLPQLSESEKASTGAQVQGVGHHHGQAEEQDELCELADGHDDGAVCQAGTREERKQCFDKIAI